MAFVGITATEAQIDQKTGAGVSISYTDTMKTQALLMAESTLNTTTRFNWSDWFAGSSNIDVKYMITEITASLVAIEAIKYDMEGYTSRIEAEDMINVLRDSLLRNLSVLRDTKVQDFMVAA